MSKISYTELMSKLRDEETDEAELRAYFLEEKNKSAPFNPIIAINQAAVEMDDELEGDVAVSAFNWFCKRKRQKRYHRKIRNNENLVRIVSEGDSWFQYPIILDDVIDHLFDEYAIYSLGGAGHLLEDMLEEDEISDALRRENPHILLLSGGGNDCFGDGRLAQMVNKYDENQPHRPAKDYINSDFSAFLEKIRTLFSRLFERMSREFPTVKIVIHGYDRAIPDKKKGDWLAAPLEKQGIKDKDTQVAIISEMIDRFNYMQSDLAHTYHGRVFHVDCRDVVMNRWHDELHPNNDGYKAVAARFQQVIDKALGENMENCREPLCPGKEATEDDTPLSPMDKAQIAIHRARTLHPSDLEMPFTSNQTELDKAYKDAEADIANYYEKISNSNDLLAAKFLPDGAAVSAAVCRIVTPTSYGSGALIANKNFIITNNHVLEDKEIAARSRAQFGYEEDGELIEVTLKPDQFFVTNSAKNMDYTIVACDPEHIKHLPALPLLRNPATVTPKERVNIIQHPRGRQKEVGIRDNRVLKLNQHVMQYRTDTEPGSSGSPVFNDQWQFVALHHAGWYEDRRRREATNEGIRVSAIVADLLNKSRSRSESSMDLSLLIREIIDSSPYLGFFDSAGVLKNSDLEVEVPDFRGHADFADIMVWNIEHFNNDVSDSRVRKVAEVLHNFALDIMGLVEVQEQAMHKVVTKMSNLGANMDFVLLNVNGSQDIAVLFNKDTSQVNLRQDINSKYAGKLSQRIRGKTAFPREPLFAQCTVAADNNTQVEFLFVVLHLKAFGDAVSRSRRQKAAEILREIVDDLRSVENLPVIIAGDFNDIMNTSTFSSLQNSPDLFALTADDSSGNAATYVGRPDRRSVIDHIVISNDLSPADVSGDDAAIIRLDKSMRNFTRDISDHVPLAMRLVLRDEPDDCCPDTASEPSSPLQTEIEIPDGATNIEISFNS